MHDDDTPLTEQELEDARRGQELVAAAVADTRAPQALRERIEHDRSRAGERSRPFWRRRSLALGLGAVLAAAVIAVVVVAPGDDGGAGTPTLAQVDAAARARPQAPAPELAGGQPPVLDASVGELTFPDWQKKFGWRATGARTDQIEGRTVKTVFYRNGKGARMGYAVVDDDTLAGWNGGQRVTRAGKSYKVSRSGGRTVVTWTQQGKACVIVASGTVPASRLVDLAASRNT